MGVAISIPMVSQRNRFQSMSFQTKGSMWMLAPISNKKAIGITSAGGSFKVNPATVKAEKPKPLYPLITAAVRMTSKHQPDSSRLSSSQGNGSEITKKVRQAVGVR